MNRSMSEPSVSEPTIKMEEKGSDQSLSLEPVSSPVHLVVAVVLSPSLTLGFVH